MDELLSTLGSAPVAAVAHVEAAPEKGAKKAEKKEEKKEEEAADVDMGGLFGAEEY